MANYDTTRAISVAEVFERGALTSLHSAPMDMLVDRVVVDALPYGKKRWKRPVLKPDENIQSGARCKRQEKPTETQFVELDLRAFFDSIAIERSEMAEYPEAWAQHGAEKARIFREGVNKALWTYFDKNPEVYGILDYPDGTDGTLARPEQLAPVTTAGAWSTTANMRTDVINAIQTMISKGFKGAKLLILPEICKPMLTELIANTSVPISQWVQSTLGLPVIFDNEVDSDATASAFDAYVVEPGRVHLGMAPLIVDSFNVDKEHSYYVDWETYAAVSYDSLHDGTEYLKPVIKISAISWT